MRNDHRDAVEKLRDQSQDLRNSFYDLLHEKMLDTTRLNTLSDSISNYQKQIELITFRHFSEVRSICSPEQQKQFDQIIDEALRMMHPPRRP
jgi:Spy/CpxP family protein refolding chaperone